MLVLSRKPGESITIDKNIFVTAVRFNRGRRSARIGIRAPRDIPVNREEVLFRVHDENKKQLFGDGALVLTRNIGESIMVGEEIRITLLKISGDSMKIGIDAPKNIIILREELEENVK